MTSRRFKGACPLGLSRRTLWVLLHREDAKHLRFIESRRDEMQEGLQTFAASKTPSGSSHSSRSLRTVQTPPLGADHREARRMRGILRSERGSPSSSILRVDPKVLVSPHFPLAKQICASSRLPSFSRITPISFQISFREGSTWRACLKDESASGYSRVW